MAELATQEVQQKLQLVRYEEHLALGKGALEQRDYNSAIAYFRLARGFLPTPEIDKLIEQAQKLKQSSGSE